MLATICCGALELLCTSASGRSTIDVLYELLDIIGQVSISILDRLTVAEAADRLSVTPDAVRKRVQRGTLPWEKGEDGLTYVWVDPSDTKKDASDTSIWDASRDAILDAKNETIAELRARIEDLSRELEVRNEELRCREQDWREESRRKDTIIMTMTQRIPELEAAKDSSSEQRESTVTASEDTSKGTPPDQGEAEIRRSWWQRLFGG